MRPDEFLPAATGAHRPQRPASLQPPSRASPVASNRDAPPVPRRLSSTSPASSLPPRPATAGLPLFGLPPLLHRHGTPRPLSSPPSPPSPASPRPRARRDPRTLSSASLPPRSSPPRARPRPRAIGASLCRPPSSPPYACPQQSLAGAPMASSATVFFLAASPSSPPSAPRRQVPDPELRSPREPSAQLAAHACFALLDPEPRVRRCPSQDRGLCTLAGTPLPLGAGPSYCC